MRMSLGRWVNSGMEKSHELMGEPGEEGRRGGREGRRENNQGLC